MCSLLTPIVALQCGSITTSSPHLNIDRNCKILPSRESCFPRSPSRQIPAVGLCPGTKDKSMKAQCRPTVARQARWGVWCLQPVLPLVGTPSSCTLHSSVVSSLPSLGRASLKASLTAVSSASSLPLPTSYPNLPGLLS